MLSPSASRRTILIARDLRQPHQRDQSLAASAPATVPRQSGAGILGHWWRSDSSLVPAQTAQQRYPYARAITHGLDCRDAVPARKGHAQDRRRGPGWRPEKRHRRCAMSSTCHLPVPLRSHPAERTSWYLTDLASRNGTKLEGKHAAQPGSPCCCAPQWPHHCSPTSCRAPARLRPRRTDQVS